MLSTDEVLDVLVKVTGFPIGLFKETDSKTRLGLTQKTFFCDADIDEYTVLINSKDQIIEIKNSDFAWGQQAVVDLLAEKNNPPQQPQQPSTSLPSMQTNLPVNNLPQLSAPLSFATLLDPNSLAIVAQCVADYVKLNPNCIQDLFGASPVNEASTHTPSAWNFSFIEGGSDHMTITFDASNATDQSIAEQVTASVGIDLVSGQVEYLNIEG